VSRKFFEVSYVLLAGLAAWVMTALPAVAHHVLGRPAYSLNEDSNTPPATQVETRVGDYFVNTMVFPAFPRPGEPGRINLYVSRIDGGKPFDGKVTFTVRDNSWMAWLGLADHEEKIGTQPLDDNVFRQGFLFQEAGDYQVRARFEAAGVPYSVTFPLRVGSPSALGPIAVVAGLVMLLLLGVSLIQRRRWMTGKLRSAYDK